MRDLLPKIQSNDGQFHNGNPGTGEQGTRVTDTWLNNVQEHIRDFGEELKHLLKQAELEPNPAKKTQIYDAISQIIESKRRTASTTEVGEVQLDSSTDSDAEDKAATPKAVNAVKALVTAVSRALNNYIPNSKKSSAVNSNSEDTVATSKAVKQAYDRAVDAEGKGLPLGAVVAFPKNVNPHGYLKAIGGTFNRETYPDFYVANGNSNVLPHLNRSDVGQLAYFAVDAIPDGWIEFDSIRSVVNRDNYPELFKHLTTKYGSISRVPQAQDRFIRNSGNGLRVGQTQEDAIRNITGSIKSGEQYNRNTQFVDSLNADGAFQRINGGKMWTSDAGSGGSSEAWGADFDASRVVPTADENRPKSIVFKLCIKAKNTFEDVVFWIKAFGDVQNAGALDASRLAQDLQGKAGINHTHNASDIVNFEGEVSHVIERIFTREKRGDTEIRKYPDGTMVQIARLRLTDNKMNSKQYFTWAMAFTEKPRVLTTLVSDDGNLDDSTVLISIVDRDSTNARCFFVTRETSAVFQPGVSIEFLAFGRWK